MGGYRWFTGLEDKVGVRDYTLLVYPDRSVLRKYNTTGEVVTIGPDSEIGRLRQVGINQPDSFIVETYKSSICVGHGVACKLHNGYLMEPFDPTPFTEMSLTIGEPIQIAGFELFGSVLSVICEPGDGDQAYSIREGRCADGQNPLDAFREYCRDRLPYQGSTLAPFQSNY